MTQTPPPRITETDSAEDVIGLSVERLRDQLPLSWSVTLQLEPAVSEVGWRPDAVITLSTPTSEKPARLVVECKSDITPRVAADAANQLSAYLSQASGAVGVVVAPWGSRRTREVLRDFGIGFIDPTGNIDLVVDEPALVVRVQGAEENPVGRRSSSPNLRGPKAWSLMKTLIEVKPPYGVRALAAAVGTDPGYTSRVIRALEDERLVSRTRRGPITEVDWKGLISQLTSTYRLLDSNTTSTWIARTPIRGLPAKLAESQIETRWAITGSLGANLLAPVAAPAMAVIYADDPSEIADILDLLPADSGAEVVLARPYGAAAMARSWTVDGASYVSVTQLAADCLSGMGRMPAEGEALVEWMATDEDRWRASSFDEVVDPVGR
jgi:hypothetical protein